MSHKLRLIFLFASSPKPLFLKSPLALNAFQNASSPCFITRSRYWDHPSYYNHYNHYLALFSISVHSTKLAISIFSDNKTAERVNNFNIRCCSDLYETAIFVKHSVILQKIVRLCTTILCCLISYARR